MFIVHHQFQQQHIHALCTHTSFNSGDSRSAMDHQPSSTCVTRRTHLPDKIADVRPVFPRVLHLLAPQLAVRRVCVRIRVLHVVEGESAELHGRDAQSSPLAVRRPDGEAWWVCDVTEATLVLVNHVRPLSLEPQSDTLAIQPDQPAVMVP